MQNPFPLGPVSYSGLTSYLECPACALERTHKKRPKEPRHFTTLQQTSLFGRGEPDARLVGTLLHSLVNFLHDPNVPLAKEQQAELLSSPSALVHFIHHDALELLRRAGKIRLATFFNELSSDKETFYPALIAPLLHYQRELASAGAVILAAAQRFQFKLLSTRNTFPGHPDWGGYVTLVGEFDQIRLRNTGSASSPDGVPSIMEFKKGLGGNKRWESSPFTLLTEHAGENGISTGSVLPSISHAMQLMIYWLAFQIKWDIWEKVAEAKGMIQDIRMPINQQLDLIIYNLNDGCQYQLLPTNHQEALLALTHCIFYLNWAMKSGYVMQSPEHECKKTQLVKIPDRQVQVGYMTISAQECYLLAKSAFDRFKDTVRWKKISSPES